MLNVLSLFDGMSCAQIALDKLDIPCRYYASEVDKYAIKVAKSNYPQTIHMGSVTELSWTDKNLHKHLQPQIDLLIGGSPCQGLSLGGQRLSFNDPRSKLFWEYMRIYKDCKPKYFLLENVRMTKQNQDIVSNELKVEPVSINSNLVSAQNRQRLYWTNIPFSKPKNKNIYLQDILEYATIDEDKKNCSDPKDFKGSILKDVFKKDHPKLLAAGYPQVVIVQLPRGVNKGGVKALHGKTPALSISSWQNNNFIVHTDDLKWRRVTPLEYERLQTVPDNYSNCVSKTQRYKMLGNGFTVDIISDILKGIN
jgi:DNA-cytosine methyltransferase|tara:strand:- start:148 stop:1074 length:927 start_codon:yes stop_codon:yes gene_type:complete